MLLMPTFWLNLAKELLWTGSNNGVTDTSIKKNKRSIAGIFMMIVRMAMAWLLFVVVSQQVTLINSQWSVKTMQHEKARLEYAHHRCIDMQTTNVQFIAECERLSVVMRVTPFVAAVTSVVNDWNTCITMPCTQLIRTVANHYEYKFLFILVSIGLFYYAFKLFSGAREKAIDFQDMIRAGVTREYKKQLAKDCLIK